MMKSSKKSKSKLFVLIISYLLHYFFYIRYDIFLNVVFSTFLYLEVLLIWRTKVYEYRLFENTKFSARCNFSTHIIRKLETQCQRRTNYSVLLVHRLTCHLQSDLKNIVFIYELIRYPSERQTNKMYESLTHVEFAISWNKTSVTCFVDF